MGLQKRGCALGDQVDCEGEEGGAEGYHEQGLRIAAAQGKSSDVAQCQDKRRQDTYGVEDKVVLVPLDMPKLHVKEVRCKA